MTTLQAAIPDDLHEAVLAQAEREHISVCATRFVLVNARTRVAMTACSISSPAASVKRNICAGPPTF